LNSINGAALGTVDEIKDLGVIMDGRMSFLPHIGNYLQTIKNARFWETKRFKKSGDQNNRGGRAEKNAIIKHCVYKNKY
jgi:hypothetical protein